MENARPRHERPSAGAPSYPPSTGGGVDAKHLRDEYRAPAPLPQRALRFLRDIFIVVLCALICSSLLKTYVMQVYYVPSGSMETTLMPGDRIAVNRMARDDIRRGDVVVFVDPGHWLPQTQDDRPKALIWGQRALEAVGVLPANTGEHLVKRVIGIGGDRVKCCSTDGKITVNGQEINETYLDPGIAPSLRSFDVTVPPGHVWVMGDNRPNSADSRFHTQDADGGFVPEENIVGRTFAVVYPFTHMQFLQDYSSLFPREK